MSITEQIPFLNQLPPATQALISNLLLLVLALIVVWILRKIVTRLVLVPFRGLAARTQTNLDDRVLDTLERPMGIFVLGAGVAIVATIFRLGTDLERFTDSLSRALFLAAIILFVYNLIDLIGLNSGTLERVTGLTIEERLLPFLRTVVKVFIVVMGILIIIQEFGYDVTGLVASFGVIGLAFSLAAQDTAANVFGFTAIVSDNPFKVGDDIATADFAGKVEHVGVRSTRVRKVDQSLVIVPNSKLTSAAVTNNTRLTKRRLDFMIGLTYDTSAAQMRECLQRLRDMLLAREKIEADSVLVLFAGFGDSALSIRIIANVLLADWREYALEAELINLEIMEIVEGLGLSFAFPSRTIYIENMPERPAARPGSDTQEN